MTLTLDAESKRELRYGENPHQPAWLLSHPLEEGLAHAKPLQGKALSYNNMLDADAAYRSCFDISTVAGAKNAVTIIKHLNPCGAAVAKNQKEALALAWAGDPVSAFGSIICFNQTVGVEAATFLRKRFIEVVIAPDFTEEAREIFAKKKNLRLIKLEIKKPSQLMLRAIDGGYLVQKEDDGIDENLETVTEKGLQVSEDLLHFGVMVNKNLKSNAIALVGENDGALSLWGAGMGNPNRLISTQQAVEKALENGHKSLQTALLVSDAFFPFRDNIDAAHSAGVTQIIQPGGSIRDGEVIAACNEFGIAMAVTGRRHFRH
jgi:phosphoribosylaminoimidazolecarboxamide formyltransferase/IMP cyclohydrolase